jgi:hypothetical protein
MNHVMLNQNQAPEQRINDPSLLGLDINLPSTEESRVRKNGVWNTGS